MVSVRFSNTQCMRISHRHPHTSVIRRKALYHIRKASSNFSHHLSLHSSASQVSVSSTSPWRKDVPGAHTVLCTLCQLSLRRSEWHAHEAGAYHQDKLSAARLSPKRRAAFLKVKAAQEEEQRDAKRRKLETSSAVSAPQRA